MDEPLTPDSKAFVDAYTPSQETQEAQDFFGRRCLRIANGQHPDTMPEKFTPKEDQRMKWPTDEEASMWAESAKKKARKGKEVFEQIVAKKHKILSPAGDKGANTAAATPATDEDKAGKSPVDFSPMPMVANDTE